MPKLTPEPQEEKRNAIRASNEKLTQLTDVSERAQVSYEGQQVGIFDIHKMRQGVLLAHLEKDSGLPDELKQQFIEPIKEMSHKDKLQKFYHAVYFGHDETVASMISSGEITKTDMLANQNMAIVLALRGGDPVILEKMVMEGGAEIEGISPIFCYNDAIRDKLSRLQEEQGQTVAPRV